MRSEDHLLRSRWFSSQKSATSKFSTLHLIASPLIVIVVNSIFPNELAEVIKILERTCPNSVVKVSAALPCLSD